MKTYEIQIKEILSRTIEVQALTENGAIEQVKNIYSKEDFTLNPSDFEDVFIENKANCNKLNILITNIIDYLFDDEKKHYEEDEEPANHIYLKLIEAKKLLKSQ